jgi:hypothetical protein
MRPKGGITMNEQPQPTAPVDDDGSETQETHAPESQSPGATAKSRPAYLDPSGSESTRELRDTARRRRDAEEKLQQHLMEAKEHAHHHDEDHDQQPDEDHNLHHDPKQ